MIILPTCAIVNVAIGLRTFINCISLTPPLTLITRKKANIAIRKPMSEDATFPCFHNSYSIKSIAFF